MKFEYKVAVVIRRVRDSLSYAEQELANEAMKHMGGELNTQRAWQLKGEIQALRTVRESIFQQSIDKGWWTK